MAVATGNALYHTIRNDAEIWPAISGKLYPNVLPQNAAYPAVVWGQLSDDVQDTKDGPINNGYSFQIDIFAEDYAAAQSIAQQLKSKLRWYHADIPSLGYCRISFKDQGDATYEEEKELIHIIQDIKLWVVRPA